MQILAMSKLSFFAVERYVHEDTHICDFSDCPRPHTCMGLILEGQGIFRYKGREITVMPGDIIYVPIASRYVSVWNGSPRISYISMHFAFESSVLSGQQENFLLQKVSLPGFSELRRDFNRALSGSHGDEAGQLAALGIFYQVISRVIPLLKSKERAAMDERIDWAIEYLEANCQRSVSVAELAAGCNMSVSHFHSRFKKVTGVTPVEYKNRACINQAMRLLKSGEKKSIEEISEMLGFYSAGYFRRVFKGVTGMSPREYRKTPIEL